MDQEPVSPQDLPAEPPRPHIPLSEVAPTQAEPAVIPTGAPGPAFSAHEAPATEPPIEFAPSSAPAASEPVSFGHTHASTEAPADAAPVIAAASAEPPRAEIPQPEVRPISFDPSLAQAANGEPDAAGAYGAPAASVSLTPDAVAHSAAVLEAEDAAALSSTEAGPNWMLAFVCVWSGAASINEAVALATPGVKLLSHLGFLGYTLLGLGLLGFAVEALRWGKRRGGAVAFLLLAATLLTLAGVVCLVLWSDPGRKI